MNIQHATTESGQIYYRFNDGPNHAWLNRNNLGGTPNGLVKLLSNSGITVAHKNDATHLWGNVGRARDPFPGSILEKPGWSLAAGCFGLPDGNIVGLRDGVQVEPIYSGLHGVCDHKGTLAEWRDNIASPLSGQYIPMFAIMSAFAGPLLAFMAMDDEPCFELCGRKGIGKTTVQKFANSVFGPPEFVGSTRLALNLSEYVANPMKVLAPRSDLMVNIDGADAYTAGLSEAKALEAYKAIAFPRNNGGRSFKAGRSIMMISTSSPLHKLVGVHSATAIAASSRIMTIPIDPKYPCGIFNQKPADDEPIATYVERITRYSRRLYGVAGREFLNRLLADHQKSPEKLLADLNRYTAKFRQKVGVDGSDGDAKRKADGFAIIYAGGRLAQRYGILPRKWKCGPAAHKCYRLYVDNVNIPRPFAERLLNISKKKRVVDLDAKPTSTSIQKGNVFRKTRCGMNELIIRTEFIERVFPDWATLKKNPEVKKLMLGDKPHKTAKRVLDGKKGIRCFVFQLPPIR